MQRESPLSTCCPRCGKAIVWARRDLGDGVASLEVAAWGCRCLLDDDEWADLCEEADEGFVARGGREYALSGGDHDRG